MVVTVKKYHLPPTELIPNSPHPLLHYIGVLNNDHPRSSTEPSSASTDPALTGPSDQLRPERVFDLFTSNGWKPQWIFRYGPTQKSHYHSRTHECMAVLTGEATIRFGVADVHKNHSHDGDSHNNESDDDGQEKGGIELHARAGDVFVLPAGTAHKTYKTLPPAEFALLTPGDGHSVDANDVRKALADVDLSGFTMLGAYPADEDNGEWDFAVGGESVGNFEGVWNVRKPKLDPVVGDGSEGVCGLW